MVWLQISGEFRQLKPLLQEVIADITQKMGSGMTVFLETKVDKMAEWDEVSNGLAILPVYDTMIS